MSEASPTTPASERERSDRKRPPSAARESVSGTRCEFRESGTVRRTQWEDTDGAGVVGLATAPTPHENQCPIGQLMRPLQAARGVGDVRDRRRLVRRSHL